MHLRASHASFSSCLVRAGNGAPGPSSVGSWTEALADPKGLKAWTLDRKGVLDEVRTGTSGSRRLQPRELMESRNDAEAIVGALPISSAVRSCCKAVPG